MTTLPNSLWIEQQLFLMNLESGKKRFKDLKLNKLKKKLLAKIKRKE